VCVYTPFTLNAVQLAVLCGTKLFLLAEGCGCLAEYLERFTLWLRSIRFLHGLRGIFLVSCGFMGYWY